MSKDLVVVPPSVSRGSGATTMIAAEQRPDMLDIVSLLLGQAHGQPPAARLTLIDAAAILMERARADLAAPPAEVAPPARRARAMRKVSVSPTRRPRRAAETLPRARELVQRPAVQREAVADAPGGGQGEEGDPEILDHNGVTATIGERSASIEHADRVIEVTPRQARLVACLAVAMPQPVDRKFIAGKVWPGQRIPQFYEQIISQLFTPIVAPLAEIGLTLKPLRGIGLSLQREGE